MCTVYVISMQYNCVNLLSVSYKEFFCFIMEGKKSFLLSMVSLTKFLQKQNISFKTGYFKNKTAKPKYLVTIL